MRESHLSSSRLAPRAIQGKEAIELKLARRFGVVLATAALLTFALAGVAEASVSTKTINVTNGECVNSGNPPTLGDGTTPCGSATYGATGFTGHISGSGTTTVVDYICVNDASAPGGFSSYGGTYTFTLYDAGNAVIGTTTETVNGGVPCTDGFNAVTSGSITLDFSAYGGTVAYSVSIAGVTTANVATLFSGNNSILNRVFSITDPSKANSPSVAPPTSGHEIPEAPASVLLVLSAGLVGFWFVRRQTVAQARGRTAA
jgi:hypothetical protein